MDRSIRLLLTTHNSRSSCQLEYREIYVIFSKLTCSVSIFTATDCLMQLIFIGYSILHQVISEPMNPVISWGTLLCERSRKKNSPTGNVVGL